LVGALSCVRAAERGAHELVGPVIRALHSWWNPGGLPCWASNRLRVALEEKAQAYERLVGSLPSRLEAERPPTDKYPGLSVEARHELAAWYRGEKGKNLKLRIKSLRTVAKKCAGALAK